MGGAASACDGLAAAYARVWAAIRESAARGDAGEAARLRKRAQVVLTCLAVLRCPVPESL